MKIGLESLSCDVLWGCEKRNFIRITRITKLHDIKALEDFEVNLCISDNTDFLQRYDVKA